jgi:serine/threonine protein kinase/Tfp pilus assembly protein PilF
MSAKPSIDSIFCSAIEIESPAERRALVEQACGEDADLKQQVERLLHAHFHGRSVLDAPLRSVRTVHEPNRETAGSVIGPYKLIEQVGEGGMGTVWMAQQTAPVKRVVALKVIKPGMDSKQIFARFEAERQALALMDHPNIAKVLDGGTTSAGRPYFVMDLVKGVSITRYCDEHHLTPRQRLELFIPVCQAVQHAHQKGVIHRDLKPSNVLVAVYDGKPVPKVIDFGMAKAAGQQLTEQTLVTGFGAIVGTLEYMSPEQAEINQLDIDTRSDIYSLGVLLYELLAGSPPFTKKDLERAGILEMLRVIREQEPSKPSTKLSTAEGLPTLAANRGTEPSKLTRLVRGELDWIVMKSLEKDRNRRYETANSFAMDVQRYLEDEAVQACPPTAAYRLRKFARKNRELIGAAGLFTLLLATGAGVSAWQAVRARTAEKDALVARDGEAEQRQQAEKSEARAKAVLKFFQDKVLSAARPKGQEGGLGKDATLRDALDQAEPEIAKSFADKPVVEASIRNTLGVSYWYLGENDLAVQQQERALALLRQELGPEHPDTVGIMNDLGIVLHTLGKYQEAQKLFAEAVDVKRRTLGPEDPITLRSVNNLANILAEQGHFEEASRLAKQTLQIQSRKLGPEDIFTLRSAYNLAIMLHHLGEFEESRQRFVDALEILRRVHGPEHQDTLRVMNSLGELSFDQGRLADAQKLFEQALEGQKRILGAKDAETITTMSNLADALRARGQLKEARKLSEEAIELHRRILGREHPYTLVAATVLANVLRDQGQFAEARTLYEESLPRLLRVMSPKTPETQKLMNEYAWMLATAADAKFRDPPRAVELAGEIVQHASKFAEKWTTLGVAYYRTEDWKNSVAALEKSESLAPGGSLGGVNGFFLTMAYWKLGEKDKARERYERAAQWSDKNQPNNETIRRFRAEAAETLELNEKK